VQCLSIRDTERPAEAGIALSVGSTGDSYGNALAETVIGLSASPFRARVTLIVEQRDLSQRRRAVASRARRCLWQWSYGGDRS
jgi:hypothetical protein